MWFSVNDLLNLMLAGQLLRVFRSAPGPGGNERAEGTPAPEPMLEERAPVARFSEWWPEPSPADEDRLDADIPTVVQENTIAGVLVEDRSGRRFVNLRIDDQWLDETLNDLHPGKQFKGLIPALDFSLMDDPWDDAQEKMRFVAHRILPPEGETFICPVLVCPECDFFHCTVIVAEVRNVGHVVRWNRLGVDRTLSWVEVPESDEPPAPRVSILGDLFERRPNIHLMVFDGLWTEIGMTVDWLAGTGPLTFERSDYLTMLASFRKHYEHERASEQPGR